MASWSGGTALWRDDFKDNDTSAYNSLFPHIDFVFQISECGKYLLDNTVLLESIKTDESKKGNYKLFKAFAVELPILFINLVKENRINWCTYNHIMKNIEVFLSNQYLSFEIIKTPCSYDLTNFREYTSVFFSTGKILLMAYLRYFKYLIRGKRR